MKDLWLRLRALLFRSRAERDLDDEVEFHVEMQVRKNVAAGVSESEARRLARIEFGGETLIKEQCRDQRRINFFETLFQDIRYALRGFRRTPIFALTVIATIALGLGINTAVFTIFDTYVLRPISVRDPGSLYELGWLGRNGSMALSADQYEQARTTFPAFTETFAVRNLQLRVNARITYGELVTGNYFRTLGVNAILGRTLLPSDASAPGREPVMVLSYGAWQSMFAADPGIIGKKVLVRGYPLEVVGVAPESFGGMNELPEDFWAPLSMISELDPDRNRLFRVFGRLRPDFTVAQANAALSAHAQLLTANLPSERKARAAAIRSRATSVPLSRDAILLMTPLIAAFGLVLLIACANVANMMLARAMARQREIGIRLSLGAARSRMIRQLLTESVLLAVPAAALAFVISQSVIDAGVRVMFATLPAEFTEYLRLASMQPDIRVFIFMMTAALLAAILFGLAPALQATRSSVIQAARGDFGNEHRPSRLRNALVVVQIAGCALLLICTGVLLRSANRIHAEDTGLDTGHVIEIESAGKSRARVLAALHADPIVETIAAASQVPFDSPFPSSDGLFRYGSVSPDFFNVFKIPILRGRNFTENEGIAHAPVVVVTESVASRLFPNSDAIGQSIHVVKHPDARIIGIARDIQMSVSGRELDRSLVLFPTTPVENGTSLLVRINGDTEAGRQHLDTMLDKAAPGSVDEIHKMETFVAGVQYIFRVAWWVSAAVGSLALVLAVTGIYGVLSYLVIQRRKEIGIRLAMGASEKQVIGLVLKQSLRLALIGLTAATVVGLGLSRLIATRIQSIDTFDAVGYAAAIGLVFAACLIAGFIPSLRAARIDPVNTLRND